MLGVRAAQVFGLGQRLAVDHVQRRVEQQQKAGATRVDHTGFFQNRQQLGRVGQRFAARRARHPQHCRQRGAITCRTHCSIGSLAHHSQNRAFNRLQHRIVSSDRCGFQCLCNFYCAVLAGNF